MLRTETDTREMEQDIRLAFEASNHHTDGHDYDAAFEHGQWWITDLVSGAQWSVADLNEDDFCFEQVTQGQED